MSMVGFSPRASVLRNARNSVWLLAAIFALCFVCPPLFSQTSQGNIQGGVFDQSGGAIAGAAVTVTDVARGIARNLVADGAGQYVATNLNPGTYSVRALAKGFKVEQHNDVLVEVGETVRVDMVLQPGEQTQTVTVTGEVPAVDTSDSTLGGDVANQSINQLPLNGRNFERLLELRPGTLSAVGSGTGTTQTNGRRNANDSLRVEGIIEINDSQGATLLNQVYQGGDSSSAVPIDAIQEFSTQEDPKAEYGFRDGAVISVGIKSGTNTVHGTAYAFGRDASATDAANYFTGGVTPATMEQFGGSAGGPIIKDKLFWFANFEGLRVDVGNLTEDTEPLDVSLANIQGNGAAGNVAASMVDACNAIETTNGTKPANPALIKPLSAQLTGLNTVTCTVTPGSATVENLFPTVTGTATTRNYLPNFTTVTPLNNGIFKGDYAISAHHHLSGMVFISKSAGISLSSSTGQAAFSPPLPQWSDVIKSEGPPWSTIATNDAAQYSGDWTWIPNSVWVNDLRLGYVFINDDRFAGDANLLPSNPWPNGYGMNTGVTNPLFGGLPALTFSSFSQMGGGGTRTGRRGPQGDIDLVDSVSYLHGKHAFKFGFEYVDLLADGDTYPNAYGTVKFTTLESFLQGMTNGGSIEYGNPVQETRDHWYGLFVQDDWRLTSKVTVNLGVRYEYIATPTERHNYLGNFNPSAPAATTPAVEQFGPGAPLASEYNAGPGLVSPRGGVAWDIFGNGKTVLRAGGSLLTDATVLGPFVDVTPFGANFPSIGVNNSGTAINANTPVTASLTAAQINWNTTGNTIFPSNTSQVFNGVTYTGPSCNLPGVGSGQCQTGAVDPNFKHAHIAEWNLDLQRAITNKLTLDVAYVGNHGFDEEQIVDVNQPVVGAGWDASAISTCVGSAATGYNKCTPDATAEVRSITCATCAYSSIYPYLSNIDEATTGDFSNYNALQATLQGRGYHGLSFLAGFAWSHALSINDGNSVNTSNLTPTDKNHLGLDYGNGGMDVRDRFTFAPTYNLPGFKSPGQMLEGWSVNAIVVLQTGFPWTATDTTTFDWLGTGENTNSGIGLGATMPWNYSGPPSAFTVNSANPIPCFGAAKGCTTFASLVTSPIAGLALSAVPGTTVVVPTECFTAAQAPYAGNAQLQQLALAALLNTSGACYAQNGGVLTPPAYGTVGNASKGLFVGPDYLNVDFSVAKLWRWRERYTAQFRAEFFNLFNHTDFAAPGGNPTAGLGTFGTSTSTPDSANAVLGSGGPRHIQFGLKLTF
jgi:Carboxypeptidase regulatory-like domain/TonB dependent receptor